LHGSTIMSPTGFVRVARCPVLNRTVRYFGSLSGIILIVIPHNTCVNSSIVCAKYAGTTSVRYFGESHLATLGFVQAPTNVKQWKARIVLLLLATQTSKQVETPTQEKLTKISTREKLNQPVTKQFSLNTQIHNRSPHNLFALIIVIRNASPKRLSQDGNMKTRLNKHCQCIVAYQDKFINFIQEAQDEETQYANVV